MVWDARRTCIGNTSAEGSILNVFQVHAPEQKRQRLRLRHEPVGDAACGNRQVNRAFVNRLVRTQTPEASQYRSLTRLSPRFVETKIAPPNGSSLGSCSATAHNQSVVLLAHVHGRICQIDHKRRRQPFRMRITPSKLPHKRSRDPSGFPPRS